MASVDEALAIATAFGNATSGNTNLNITANALTGMEIYWILLRSALIVVPQRSASDEFSSWTIAPTRVSPFICLADIISTLIWLLNGWHLSRGWKKSAQLAVRMSAVSGHRHRRRLRKEQNILLGLLFIIHAILTTIRAFTTEELFWEKVWVATFTAAYFVHVCVDVLAYRATPHTNLEQDQENNDNRIPTLFNIVDILSSLAYMFQIKAWIDIFGQLIEVASTSSPAHHFFIKLGIWGMIALAVLLSCCTSIEGPYKVLHGLWSLRAWTTTHRTTFLICAFSIFLMSGLPIDLERASLIASGLVWPEIFKTVGTLAIVVLMLCFVSTLHTMVRKICRVEVPGEFDDPVQDGDPLASRLNVVVKSHWKWREILSVSFGFCNLLFGFLYYTIAFPSFD